MCSHHSSSGRRLVSPMISAEIPQIMHGRCPVSPTFVDISSARPRSFDLSSHARSSVAHDDDASCMRALRVSDVG